MSSQPRYATVLFDLDGTLCNTIALIVASYQDAHRSVLGEQLDEATILPWIGRTLDDVYAAWPEHAEALQQAYLAFNLANLERLQTGYEGIAELLDELQAAGVQVAVATSKRRASALRSLAAAGLDEKVTVAAAMEDTPRHKPFADPLQHALLQLGADAEGAAYVGDATVDVLAARNAQLASFAVTWGAGSPEALAEAGPTAVCTSVDELRGWLLGPTA